MTFLDLLDLAIATVLLMYTGSKCTALVVEGLPTGGSRVLTMDLGLNLLVSTGSRGRLSDTARMVQFLHVSCLLRCFSEGFRMSLVTEFNLDSSLNTYTLY